MYVRSIVIDKAEEDDALLRNACVGPVKEDAVKAEAVTTKPAKMQERIVIAKAKSRCTDVMILRSRFDVSNPVPCANVRRCLQRQDSIFRHGRTCLTSN